MKLNERVYEALGYKVETPEEIDAIEAKGEEWQPTPATPIEVQELEGHHVELYSMNEHQDILEEFTQKGKFAVWSSQDGTNYRLALEEKYYEKTKELYSKDVNGIWLKFWDDCDKIQRDFQRKIVLPMTIVVIALFLFIVNIGRIFSIDVPTGLDMGLTLGLPIVYIIIIMFLRKNVMNKINKSQADSVAAIEKKLGTKKFNELLKNQRTYIDEYFKSQEEEDASSNEDTKELLTSTQEESNQEDKASTPVEEESKDDTKEE